MISIHKGNLTLDLKTFLFPGGEVGVKLDASNLRYRSDSRTHQTIVARLQDAIDIVTLIMTVDALRRFDPTPIRLFMPYVPYARQDRVCVTGEAFSLKAFAAVVNALGFERVTVVDPHSDVVGAVFDRLEIITQRDVISRYAAFSRALAEGPFVFVSPDAGANKKTAELARYFEHDTYVRADKKRNLETGAIIETLVYGDVAGQTLVIADDICDGGRTFIELATVLKRGGATRIILFVTHGIFSKGLKPLLDGGIDEIYTTNSYRTQTGAMNALALEDVFSL